MPDFQVIKCFSCSTFQVQQAKKAGKFKCTMCGTSQTLQKIYAVSSDARDCRQVCMGLNEARGRKDETTADDMADHQSGHFHEQTRASNGGQASTNWQQYLEDEEEMEEEEAHDLDVRSFTTSVDQIRGAMVSGRGRGAYGEDRGGSKRQRSQGSHRVDEEEDQRRMPPPPRTAPLRTALAPLGNQIHTSVRIPKDAIEAIKAPAQKLGGKWSAYVDEEEEDVMVDDD